MKDKFCTRFLIFTFMAFSIEAFAAQNLKVLDKIERPSYTLWSEGLSYREHQGHRQLWNSYAVHLNGAFNELALTAQQEKSRSNSQAEHFAASQLHSFFQNNSSNSTVCRNSRYDDLSKTQDNIECSGFIGYDIDHKKSVGHIPSPTSHSEGLTWIDDQLWNVSLRNPNIYSISADNDQMEAPEVRGESPKENGQPIIPWGMTTNGTDLIISGGKGQMIYVLNKENLDVIYEVALPFKKIEDIAWDEQPGGFKKDVPYSGQIIWTSQYNKVKYPPRGKAEIFAFELHSGEFVKYKNNGRLRKAKFRIPEIEKECTVIDGIAISAEGLWVTGKLCPHIYLVEKPDLSL